MSTGAGGHHGMSPYRLSAPATAVLGRRRTARLRRLIGARRRTTAGILAALAVLLAVRAARPDAGPVTGGAPVVVAAHDLAAGATVRAGDLRTALLPAAAVPDGAARSAAALTGRTVAGAVRRGEPLTDARLVGPGLLAGGATPDGRPAGGTTPDGTAGGATSTGGTAGDLVATPVRIADAATVGLVRVGDHVDVLAAAAQSTGVDTSSAGTSSGDPDAVAARGADAAAGTGSSAGTGSGAGQAAVAAADAVILAVPPADRGSAGSSGSGDGALVVLATSPATALRLALAAVTSRLSLTVRPGR